MDTDRLKKTAQAMVAPGKGILAADESLRTSEKRFKAVGVEHTEENRRLYRQMLVTAPGMENFISGYILFDETIRQKTDDGMPFPKLLADKGILPGIKVDTGAKDLALHEGEKVTEGLDGLRERLREYVELGAMFCKWRAVITIGENMPSQACYMANSHALARYAALCQEAGLVPMVEPEVLINGDHSIERCYEVTAENLQILFSQLQEQEVMLEGTILKTSMVISGMEAKDRANAQQVAEQTVKCLKENVPAELAGIVFLSGGQAEEEATVHLNEMNKMKKDLSWPLTFSYARAIQNPAQKIWSEDPADKEITKRAQKVLAHRAEANSLASLGKYKEDFEKDRGY